MCGGCFQEPWDLRRDDALVLQSKAPTKTVSAGALGQGAWMASVHRLAPRSFRPDPAAAARGGRHAVGRQSPRNDAL